MTSYPAMSSHVDKSATVHASSAPATLSLLVLFVMAWACAATPALGGFIGARAAYRVGNFAVAFDEFRRAAEGGHAGAQYHLGMMYRRGQGVRRNFADAARWYRKAGEQGHVRAQYWLGVMHRRGQGVERDRAEAVKWFRKAGELGHAMAQYYAGVAYERGKGWSGTSRKRRGGTERLRNRVIALHRTTLATCMALARGSRRINRKPGGGT